MKKITAFCLILILIFTAIPVASAASDEAVNAADHLYNLGLFAGTGTDAQGKPIYDLDRAPTRQEAITMFVRILGKNDEAIAGTWETPFTDVDEWAKPYVGYAYANGLTMGTSATTFDGKSAVTATQYLTLILRALGYTSGIDFQWDKAWELSDQIGLTDGRYSAGENSKFQRADLVIVSNSALKVNMKDTTRPLISTIPSVILPWKADSSKWGYEYIWWVNLRFSAGTASDLQIQSFKYNYIDKGKVIASGSFNVNVLKTDKISAGQSLEHYDMQVNKGYDRIEYLLCCTDKNGKEVVLKNTFAIVRDLSLTKTGFIHPFRLANMLGGVTLSEAQANALIGTSPENIRDSVKTAGDMLMYMIAADYKSLSGDQQINVSNITWHYNHTARHALSVNGGNCGATANLASFLLADDYEEVGFLSYSGLPGEGGHNFNYFKYNNKYHIVDFVHYAGNYVSSSEFNILILDSLEDFGSRWRECCRGVEAIVAFTSPGTHFPFSLPASTGAFLLPEGTDFAVLYESQKVQVSTALCPVPPLPDWRLPQ